MEGWIKLHRKLLKSDVFENEKLLKMFVWCLIKASRTEREQVIGATTVNLLPGQFVTGRRKASIELGIKESTVTSCLKRLEKMNIISMKSNRSYTIVTVDNWELYQDGKEMDNNKTTTNSQQNNTNKKEEKEKNNNICRFTPPNYDEVYKYCVERNNGIDAQKFIDFYTAKGWLVGKNKMKDWKAAVRTWEKGNTKSNSQQVAGASSNSVNLDQNGYMPIDAL